MYIDNPKSFKMKSLPKWIDLLAGIILFTANHKTLRKNLTLKISKDDGETWSAEKTIYKGPAAYAALSLMENGDLGIIFEKDDYTQNSFVRLPKDQILSLLE